ncbi:serine hydrolase domain-containing protein [Haoranjiania flava]|uniref:Beta-lactamase family protein n=1 Tax=Haoranjiania flava TaxID=1856322 RepID=A0AAE3IM03_9BACT|nr:serine hydrolase domain-containing protein [Haoranjiania flava]MCU7693425.1 beta-lactamase family protein [Haoranjiania flava]
MKYKFLVAGVLFFAVAFACKDGNQSKQTKHKKKWSIAQQNDSFRFAPLSESQKNSYTNAIQSKFDSLFPGERFNGQILIAKNGVILFEKYQGYHDFRSKTPITPHTPLHLASISKTFTGVALLRLFEQGRVSLDDTIQKFFPMLPYHGVTVRDLLSHRSGIPNYLYVMDKGWDKKKLASNMDIINFMVDNKVPKAANPNRVFQYCNTNYIILASIIEQITKQNFPDYMRDSIFLPLGMKDTYVFSKKDSANYVETYSTTRGFPMDPYDASYGDKNVYSTVQDLLKWDKSFYSAVLLRPETIRMSYMPLSNERPSVHNYGLGWRMLNNPTGDTVIYHNGMWHGTNSVFTRLVQDSAVIIIIGNKTNKNIYKGKEFARIFSKSHNYDILNPLE